MAELTNESKDFRRHAGPLASQSLRGVGEDEASLIQRECVLHEFGAGTRLGKRRRLNISGIRESAQEDIRHKFAQDSVDQDKGHSIREIFGQHPGRAIKRSGGMRGILARINQGIAGGDVRRVHEFESFRREPRE